LFEFTTPYHEVPSCRFCSQCVQNGHFLITHNENQTVPRILFFPGNTSKYCSLLIYSTTIAFVHSNLANLSEICFKRQVILVLLLVTKRVTLNKEVAILYNANSDSSISTNMISPMCQLHEFRSIWSEFYRFVLRIC